MTGSELKTLRKHLGLSLETASRHVSVNPATWCRWEKGAHRIPAAAVKLFLLINADEIARIQHEVRLLVARNRIRDKAARG